MTHRDLSADARGIFQAAIDSVLGDRLMRATVAWDAGALVVGSAMVDAREFDRIVLVGAGKASGAMASGFAAAVGDRAPLIGHINVPEGQDTWTVPDEVRVLAARPAGVNEPTETCIRGTDRILELVRQAGPRDLVVVLISGGGSALLCRPADGISLEQKCAVIRNLSAAGCDIVGLNTVRKHLSGVKGGRLASALRHGRMVSVILSDVLGDPVDLIASGPTVEDTSQPADALAIVERFDPDQTLPAAIRNHLQASLSSPMHSAIVPTDRVQTVVVGNNAVAVDAAGIRAESLGYNHIMHAVTSSEGNAEDVGVGLADMTLDMLRRPNESHPHDAIITGGEPVVQLAESSIRGRGGRNQQLVLAAYLRLLESDVTPAEWARISLLSGGTDGEDGPTDAAGAIINDDVHQRALAAGLDPKDALARNDAYTFFKACGGLLQTGPTGTNVCDVRVALVRLDLVG